MSLLLSGPLLSAATVPATVLITGVTLGAVSGGAITLTINATPSSIDGSTLYYVMFPDGDPSPNKTETYLGQASGGGAPLAAGSDVISGGGVTFTLPGGIPEQNVRVVAGIDNGVQSEVVVSSNTVAVDTVLPAFVSGDPADDATDIAIDKVLVGTFSKNVLVGTGNFRVYEDTVLVETFDTDVGTGDNGGTISVSGTGVTITAGANFTNGAVVDVEWDQAALVDAYDNELAANATSTLWNFTVVAAAASSVYYNDPLLYPSGTYLDALVDFSQVYENDNRRIESDGAQGVRLNAGTVSGAQLIKYTGSVSANQFFEVKIKDLVDLNTGIYLCFRIIDANNYAFLRVVDGQTIFYGDVIAGSSNLQTNTGHTPANLERIRVEVRDDSTVRVFVDDVQIWWSTEATLSSLTSGVFGLRIDQGNANVSGSISWMRGGDLVEIKNKEAQFTTWWDSFGVPDGAVNTLADQRGLFELTALNAPTAGSNVIQFNGSTNVFEGTNAPGDNRAYALSPTEYVGETALPDAEGSDVGQGFSMAGFTQMPDGTWWAANGGKSQDGVSQTGDTGAPTDVRKQTLVHLSADFTTNLGEIDIDALWENQVSPQDVAYDAVNDWFWVCDVPNFAIRAVSTAGAHLSANDITGLVEKAVSLTMSEDGTKLWYMTDDPVAKFYTVETDGSKTVTLVGTCSLDNRQDKIAFYEGVLYVTCGSNAEQGYIVAVDPVSKLGETAFVYPTGPIGLVGVEGLWVGPGGKLFLAHNGYFHVPQAPDTNPATNIVVEYRLPKIGHRTFDLFWLGKVNAHTGTDCIFQVGSPSDNPKTYPSFALWCNSTSLFIRKNMSTGADEAVSAAMALTTLALNHIQVRNGAVTFYQNGVQVGTGSFTGPQVGGWGPGVNKPQVGASVTGGSRYTSMDWYAGGYCIGANDRQWIEGVLAHRHSQTALLPAGHPYKTATPFNMPS